MAFMFPDPFIEGFDQMTPFNSHAQRTGYVQMIHLYKEPFCILFNTCSLCRCFRKCIRFLPLSHEDRLYIL